MNPDDSTLATAMMGARFPYQTLEAGSGHFRLLELHPGRFGDRISCSVMESSLDSKPEYEALSYTWGNPHDLRCISLNGFDQSITTSLEIALQYLRNPNSVRRLWVDALCINQLDIEERSHQVAQMRYIYQSASTVLVWLGPHGAQSEIGFKLIEELAQRIRRRTPDQSLPIGELDINVIEPLLSVLHRPYWRRVWILQEVAVAACDPMIGCGSTWLSWTIWRQGILHIYMHLGTPKFSDGIHGYESRIFLDRFFDVDRLRLSFFDFSDRGTNTVYVEGDENRSNILEVLQLTNKHVATDPKDHIFGVLGLFRSQNGDGKRSDAALLSLRFNIIPDYTKTLSTIYCEAFDMFLKTEETLEILKCHSRLRCNWLPSFVPDFEHPLQLGFPNNMSNNRHRDQSSGLLRSPGARRPKLSDDMKTLIVDGFCIDKIDKIVDLRDIRTAPTVFIRKICKEIMPNGEIFSDPIKYQGVMNSIWRTLIANRSLLQNNRPCGDDYQVPFTRLCQVEDNLEISQIKRQEGQGVLNFLTAMFRAISHYDYLPHRRFIISASGHLGLGTPNSEKGDAICILRGYSMPVILRPVEDHYEYLGSAYVHGIMDGEGQPSAQSGQTYSTFTIR